MRAIGLALVLLLSSLVAAPAQAQPTKADVLLEIADPPSDVVATTPAGSSPALPSQQHVDLVDLTKVRVLDPDEEFLVFEVSIKGTLKPWPTNYGGSYQNTFQQNIYFKVPGQGGIKVDALLQVVSAIVINQSPGGAQTVDPILVRAQLCLGARGPYCGWEAVTVAANIVDGHIEVKVPKVVLLRIEGARVSSRTAALPTRLMPGDELTDMYVHARTGFLDFTPVGGEQGLRAEDRAPNSGLLSFRLAHASPTGDIRIRGLPSAVVQGEENVVQFEVTNLAANKRILNLSAEILRATDDGPWDIDLTSSVTLAAGKGTNVTLRVQPPVPGSDHEASADIRIRANVVTEPGTVAIAYTRLQAQLALDAAHNTFYVHGATDHVFDVPLPLLFSNGWGVLTRYEDESRFADQPMQLSGGLSFGLSGGHGLYLAGAAIPNPARFRAGQPISFHVELESDAPAAGTLSANVRMGEQTVSDASKTVTLVRGKNPVDLEIPVPQQAARIDPANGTIRVFLRLQLSQPESSLVGLGATKVYLLPKASVLKLPVDREAPTIASRPNYQVALAPAEELQGFVNPGRTIVYELDLRNEDAKRLGLTLELENITEGWTAAIQPSTRYRLDASDAAHIGIVLQAPAQAKEASTSAIRLIARESETGEIVAGQWLRTLVTSGVEIENETFESREEDAGKVEQAPKKGSSPGVGVPVLLLSLALLVGVWRRRRA